MWRWSVQSNYEMFWICCSALEVNFLANWILISLQALSSTEIIEKLFKNSFSALNHFLSRPWASHYISQRNRAPNKSRKAPTLFAVNNAFAIAPSTRHASIGEACNLQKRENLFRPVANCFAAFRAPAQQLPFAARSRLFFISKSTSRPLN